MTSSWKPHKSIRYKGSHEPGAYTNRNCIPKKSRTLMTMTSKFHPWFTRKSILTRHLNTLRGLRYHGLDMRVRGVTWTTLCHNNVSFWLLTSTKLLMNAHILGSLMGFTNLFFKWRNLKHFSYLCDCHSISLHDYNERVFGIDKHWLFSNNSISYYDTRVDFSEVWVAICPIFLGMSGMCVCVWHTVKPSINAPNPNT